MFLREFLGSEKKCLKYLDEKIFGVSFDIDYVHPNFYAWDKFIFGKKDKCDPQFWHATRGAN